MLEHEKSVVAARMEQTKARLSHKLEELGRRFDGLHDWTRQAREYATKPVVLFAISALVGLWLGSRRRGPPPLALTAGDTPVQIAAAQPTISRSVLREVLVVSAGFATRRYLNKRLSGA